MFTITWSFKGFVGNQMSFFSREEANECWTLLKQSGATNMKAESDQPKEPVFDTVSIVFYGGVKEYTYLTRKPIERGALVVVETSDGREVVQVTRGRKQTKTELEALLPLEKYKYIVGEVIA